MASKLAKVATLRAATNKTSKTVDVKNIDGQRQPDLWDIYADKKPHICLLEMKNTKKGITATKLTREYRCREELARRIMEQASEGHKPKLAAFMIRSKDSSSGLTNNLIAGIRVLNYFERKARWGLSLVLKTQEKNCAILVGSSYWAESGLNISLYLLIARLLCKYPVKARETPLAYIKRMVKSRNGTTDQEYLKKLLDRHGDFIQLVMKHRIMLSNGLDLSDDEGLMDCGYEGSDYLSEMAVRVSEVKDTTYGRGQAKTIKRLLSHEDNYRYDEYGNYKDDMPYDPDLDDYSVSSVNRSVVIALEKLLRKYKGKRVKL